MYKSETYAIHVLTSGFWGTNELKQTQTLKNSPILVGNRKKHPQKNLKFRTQIQSQN